MANTEDPAVQGALACARLGMRVFPVWQPTGAACRCPNGAECTNAGKHPIELRWQRSATTAPRQIDRWFGQYNGCNFGISSDDLPTVDVDPRHGGSLESLPDWLPSTPWRVNTGGGGWHLGYRSNGEAPRGRRLAEGVDLKGRGGFVVAPGSLHASGRRYSWEAGAPPDADAVPEWPRGPDAAPDEAHDERSRLIDLLASPPEAGKRNIWMAAVAGHYASAFKHFDSYAWHVQQAADLLEEPLPPEEIEATTRSIWSAEQDKPTPASPGPVASSGYTRMVVRSFAEMKERAAEEVAFLVDPLWPGGAYGVLGAEDKAGKTWAAVDLAISVATATPWLGHFKVPQSGVVLSYIGEGGDRPTVRRIEAIAHGRGLTADDLGGIYVALAAPRLSGRGNELGVIAGHLETHSPRLVVVDPLYLAAAGAKGSDLYAMGEMLVGIQELCEQAEAALVMVAHWNKTGTGTGPERFTGVGPGAWGRVLGSAEVKNRRSGSDSGSSVLLGWEFRGSEIADYRFGMWRHVRAEDPHDLSSPMHYEVEVVVEDFGDGGTEDGTVVDINRQRVLNALGDAPPPGEMFGPERRWLTVREIGDVVAADKRGTPLTSRTIQRHLAELRAAHMAEPDGPQRPRHPVRWRRT